MKKGAIYVNTSRGRVQQERALFEALTRGQLAAAGIDVFEEEPTSLDNPLFNLPNVVVLVARRGRHAGGAPARRRCRSRARCCACCAARSRTCS